MAKTSSKSVSSPFFQNLPDKIVKINRDIGRNFAK